MTGAEKTYRRIGALDKGMEILEFLGQQREPVPAPEIAAAVQAPAGTVMCHLATLEDRRFVRRIGGGWELGMALAQLWARKKSLLESARDRLDRDLATLHITGGAG